MDSSSKVLSSEDPKNEDHQDEQTSTPPPDFSLVASHSCRGRNIFPQFNKLSPEIQGMIFERSSLSSLTRIATHDFFEGLFNTIEENCQALEKFNLVTGGIRSWDGREIQENGGSTKTWRLLEIDEDFRAEIYQAIDGANWAMDKLEKHVERKRALKDHAAVEYWRRVGAVPAILGWMEGRKEKEPRLWFPALKHTLACHEDGSPLDQYKGLAQIFDDASW
ncbi:hypothetical protein EAF04_002455 [Stromatinia cepivora]|nr:hypothetical protein EAF04_002455 [Stromatinia cepivora]